MSPFGAYYWDFDFFQRTPACMENAFGGAGGLGVYGLALVRMLEMSRLAGMQHRNRDRSRHSNYDSNISSNRQ